MAGRRSSFLLSPVLWGLSLLFAVVLRIRHWLYDRHMLPIYYPKVKTISIGNLTVGGTGKTPVVQYLARLLSERGKVAILTRGFRGEAEKSNIPLRVEKGDGISAKRAGDEPRLLADSTEAVVWVSRDRCQSACLAEAEGADYLLLDDGLQHRRLHRDVEVVVMDANNLFDRHRLLPYGRLRDLPERLRKADLVIANHAKNFNQYEAVKKALSEYTQAPVVAMRPVLDVKTDLKGCRIGVFCGLANPTYFLEALRELGAEIVVEEILLDHQKIEDAQLDALLKKAHGLVVCTEKDYIKLSASWKAKVMPIGMHLEVVGGEEWIQKKLSQ